MLRVTAKNLKSVIHETSALTMTDSHRGYIGLAKKFAAHQTVNHMAHEYARGPAHVNTAEGYFSLLKRGINGTFVI